MTTWTILYLSILILLTLFYLGCLRSLLRGLKRLSLQTSDKLPTVSVVIAARNEARNINRCINALEAQDYPHKKTEIIIVDDRSEDATADIIRSRITKNSHLKLIQIKKRQPGLAPKKLALATGIGTATGEIIFTTDADCRPVPTWISTIMKSFTPKVGLVAGFSPLESESDIKSLPQKLVTLDSLSLACVAAGGIGLGRAATCSGRNLAYRKLVYEQVNGFSKISKHISGDDDLFLHLVSQETDWKIHYVLQPNALVYSDPAPDFATFFNQRTRHASKGKHYHFWLTSILILVYLFNLMLLIGGLSCLLGGILPIFIKVMAIIVISFALKAASEYCLLVKGARLVHKQYLLKVFPIAALLHIPYVVIFGLLGTFKTFSWKGEQFQAEESL